jgi:CubicO group peptidase (beta-lactamase class C family)
MRRALTALITAVLLLGTRAPAQSPDPLLSLWSGYLEALRVQTGIPGLAAAIVGRNDILWEYGFGRQDVERGIATRPDTPFHVDGLTQMLTASLVLRCTEEGRLSLDDQVGRYVPASPDAAATLRDLLSHATGAPNLTFAFRPERLDPIATAVKRCTNDSFRETLANLLDRLAMVDSVPGPDVIRLAPPDEGIPTAAEVQRYKATLDRLAVGYLVDAQRRTATPTQYTATTLTPASGVVSTVRDLAQFDLALKRGILLRGDTLAAAWQPPMGRDGQPLAHAQGWFVTSHKGERVVWQFGSSDIASSSLFLHVPGRGLTLILLANSSGLAKGFPLATGDLLASPFARLFLGQFVK